MRAIDIDKLEWFQVVFGENKQKAIIILKPHILDLDIIEAEPVIHSKWKPGEHICPICKQSKYKDLDADIWADWQPSYCPNCGAKMDLK